MHYGHFPPRFVSTLPLLLLLAFGLNACTPKTAPDPGIPGVPDPVRGKAAMTRYGCAVCHVIPGIPGATGKVGPSLEALSKRTQLAGALPNTPENLVRWIREPRSVSPRTAMPTMGVSEAEAKDIASYLSTLE